MRARRELRVFGTLCSSITRPKKKSAGGGRQDLFFFLFLVIFQCFLGQLVAPLPPKMFDPHLQSSARLLSMLSDIKAWLNRRSASQLHGAGWCWLVVVGCCVAWLLGCLVAWLFGCLAVWFCCVVWGRGFLNFEGWRWVPFFICDRGMKSVSWSNLPVLGVWPASHRRVRASNPQKTRSRAVVAVTWGLLAAEECS